MNKNKKRVRFDGCYTFKAKLWKYDGPAGWCFVTIPKSVAKKIRATHNSSEEGWGRLKTTATIGNSTWKTSIWFDTKAGSYLLPVKTSIRKSESLVIGTQIKGQLEFDKFLIFTYSSH